MRLKMLLQTLLMIASLAMDNHRAAQNFKTQQAQYPRVQEALAEKEAAIKQLFAAHGFAYPPTAIFLRAFKREGALELWAKKRPTREARYELVKTYKVCAASGRLGPKRQQGDEQVPEGFYYIDRFNPVSNFHLSLGINYPNESDKRLGARGNLGGDIFIHGNCVSIGCMAIQDEQIKELYLIAIEAKSAGQPRIPVHVFPARMHTKGMKRLEREAASNAPLLVFWKNLKEGFDIFENDHRLPVVTVDRQGRYLFK
jgi:murein L,D-transpeptidase YafK